jgi:hypothetical protein
MSVVRAFGALDAYPAWCNKIVLAHFAHRSPEFGFACALAAHSLSSFIACVELNFATVFAIVVRSLTLRHRSINAASSARSACESNAASESALAFVPRSVPRSPRRASRSAPSSGRF